MMNDFTYKLCWALIIAVIVFSLGFVVKEKQECDARGKTLVRGLFGWECVSK